VVQVLNEADVSGEAEIEVFVEPTVEIGKKFRKNTEGGGRAGGKVVPLGQPNA
jgi:hypothetical protein